LTPQARIAEGTVLLKRRTIDPALLRECRKLSQVRATVIAIDPDDGIGE
jgi:hypothetical protein